MTNIAKTKLQNKFILANAGSIHERKIHKILQHFDFECIFRYVRFFAIMLVLKPFYLQYFKIHKFVLQSIGSPVDLLMLLFLKIGLKF